MMVNNIESSRQIKESGGTELPFVKVPQSDVKEVLEGRGSGVMSQESVMIGMYQTVLF